MFALCHKGEINHHDRILLNDTYEQHNADDGDDIEIGFEEHERDDGADAGRWQRGDNREWVHQALIENAENDIDGQQRSDDEIGLGAERRLIGLECPRKESVNGLWGAEPLLHLLNKLGGLAQRYVWSEIKRNSGGWEDASVRYGDRCGRGCSLGHGGQRDDSSPGMQVDIFQPLGRLPIWGSHLQHDIVLIHLRIDERDFGLAKS